MPTSWALSLELCCDASLQEQSLSKLQFKWKRPLSTLCRETRYALFVAHDGLRRGGVNAIVIWPSGFNSLRCFPHLQVQSVWFPTVPHPPSPSPPPSRSPVHSLIAGVAVLLTALDATAQPVPWQQGSWGREGSRWENAAARVCKEAGTRIRTNVMVREMGLAPNVDNRRLEVVADGLPLFGGAQIATRHNDCALRRNGTSRPQADSIDGVALAAARRNKARTCGGDGRARLVVLAAEVGKH